MLRPALSQSDICAAVVEAFACGLDAGCAEIAGHDVPGVVLKNVCDVADSSTSVVGGGPPRAVFAVVGSDQGVEAGGFVLGSVDDVISSVETGMAVDGRRDRW